MTKEKLFTQFMATAMPHVQPDSPYWKATKIRFNKGTLHALRYLDLDNRRKLLKILSTYFVGSTFDL